MFVKLKDELDRYHHKRLQAYGALYTVVDPSDVKRFPYVRDDRVVRRVRGYEAKSIATGETCLLAIDRVEIYKEADHELI